MSFKKKNTTVLPNEVLEPDDERRYLLENATAQNPKSRGSDIERVTKKTQELDDSREEEEESQRRRGSDQLKTTAATTAAAAATK